MTSSYRFGAFGAVAALMAMVLIPGPRIGRAEEKKQKTELSHHMEQIDTAMKKLKRTIRKAETDKETLQLIATVEKEAVAAKALTPVKAASVPEAQRAKFITGYQQGMASFLSDVCQMEIAVLQGDHTKAHEIYLKLKDDEDKGHDQFMPDEDKDSVGKD